jgi:hypothetical protein
MIEHLANFLGSVARDVLSDLDITTIPQFAQSGRHQGIATGVSLEITPTFATDPGGLGWEATLIYATRGYVGSEQRFGKAS